MADQVIVGTVGRALGLRGQVTVRPRTDAVEDRFAVGASLAAVGRRLVVTAYSWQQGRLVVSFEGVGDRTAAEALRGLDLWADGPAETVGEDEFHDTELIGLVALDPSGARLGEVVAVQHHPAQDLLVVRTDAGERLVPFVADLVPQVDPAAGHLVIDPIPGLLEEVPDAD